MVGMNIQPIQKQHLQHSGYLGIHHIFPTIQGEGPFAGVPAVFIRLYGCNLQCPKCDTDYTTSYYSAGPAEILSTVELLSSPSRLVVLTGGEPFRQNLTPTVLLLLSVGFKVQIETNGTLYLEDFPYDRVTIICSPKAGQVNRRLRKHITAYKYVLSHDSISPVDGLPIQALEHPASPYLARPAGDFEGTVYVQPAENVDNPSDNQKNLAAAIESCLDFGYTLCVQIHKMIGME